MQWTFVYFGTKVDTSMCAWLTLVCSDATKEDIGDLDKHRNLTKLEDLMGGTTLPKGQLGRPCIDCIEMNDIVVDLLHLQMRVGEQVLKFFIEYVVNHAPRKTVAQAAICAEFKLVGVESFRFLEKEDKGRKYTSITGAHMKLVLSNFEPHRVLPADCQGAEQLATAAKVRQSMRALRKLFAQVDDTNTSWTQSEIDDFKQKAKEWVTTYKTQLLRQITPYMHIMVQHLPQMMERHKSLVRFRQDGAEKAGGMRNTDLQRLSTHGGFNRDEMEEQLVLDYSRLLLQRDVKNRAEPATKVKGSNRTSTRRVLHRNL